MNGPDIRSKNLKALLFDVDGTLANTERDGHRIAFNRAFADAGLDWIWGVETYGRLLEVSGGKERIRAYARRWHPEFRPAHGMGRFVEEIHRRKTRCFQKMLKKGSIALRPGVARLLRETRAAGLKLAIATTTARENAEALLQSNLGEAGVSWFDAIAAGDVVPAKKPAPDIYHLVLQQLGLAAQECLALEDSRNGLLAATGAGITTVVTVNDYTRQQDFGGAALVLDQLGEPGAGFRVLEGRAGHSTYVDLALLQRLVRT